MRKRCHAILAALRGGIKTVLIPEGNKKDLADIPDKVKEEIDIMTVERVSEVLDHALVRKPEPVNWDEDRVLRDQIS